MKCYDLLAVKPGLFDWSYVAIGRGINLEFGTLPSRQIRDLVSYFATKRLSKSLAIEMVEGSEDHSYQVQLVLLNNIVSDWERICGRPTIVIERRSVEEILYRGNQPSENEFVKNLEEIYGPHQYFESISRVRGYELDALELAVAVLLREKKK